MRILRVFPRRTNATPRDDLVRIGEPGLFDPPDCDEVHVSVAFTWDRDRGQHLADSWAKHHPRVRIGGPAMGSPAEEFVPGRYLGEGHVITSRGCPNRCWFCWVPEREGGVRELPICDGWKIHDSNLLACSEQHIRAVFEMLDRQAHRPEFLGGLEAALLEAWHVDLLANARPRRIFFAYDTPNDLGPLQQAGAMLTERAMRECYCFVLVGYSGDDFDKAEKRCREAHNAGFMPVAMLYRDEQGQVDRAWRRWQRVWCRPALTRAVLAERLEAGDGI